MTQTWQRIGISCVRVRSSFALARAELRAQYLHASAAAHGRVSLGQSRERMHHALLMRVNCTVSIPTVAVAIACAWHRGRAFASNRVRACCCCSSPAWAVAHSHRRNCAGECTRTLLLAGMLPAVPAVRV